MKKIKRSYFLSLILFININYSFAQTPSAFSLPDGYHFEREIIQVLKSHKNPSDSTRIFSYYTNSGEYASVRMEGSPSKPMGQVVITKTGSMLFFNEKEKTVTVINIQNILKDIANLAKWIKMDSLMAAMRRHTEGNEIKSVRTGQTKTIFGYPADQYSVTDKHGHISMVWCAKVDFPVIVDYILGAGAGKWLPMISTRLNDHPLFQELISPGVIATDVQTTDSLGKTATLLRTESIQAVSWDFKTAGYKLIDYSNYSLMEILRTALHRE